MNSIQSILRHWFTLGATAATVWLASFLVMGPDDQATLTEAFSKLIEPLIAIAVLLIAALWRLVLVKAPTIFRRDAGGSKNDGSGTGMVPMLAGLCMAAGLMGFCLPSCSPAQIAAVREMPIRIGVQGPDGAVSYSSKGGLQVDAVISRSAK